MKIRRETNLGHQRIKQLAWNTRYFRQCLTRMGFIVYGHPHSPVVPALLYSPSKIAYEKRHLLLRENAIEMIQITQLHFSTFSSYFYHL
jgi:serine palmitoyltransferase